MLQFDVLNDIDRSFFTKMEVFFKLNYENIFDSSFDGKKMEWSNSTTCLVEHYNSFFKYFSHIEVNISIYLVDPRK